MRISGIAQSAFIAAAVLASAACVPCKQDSPVRGTWTIATVNGQPVPSSGLEFPGRSDRLKSGVLRFRQETIKGCSEGIALGGVDGEIGYWSVDYTLVTSGGQTKPNAYYSGAYDYDNSASGGKLTMSANGQSVEGLHQNDALTFQGTFPDLEGLVVVLRRL